MSFDDVLFAVIIAGVVLSLAFFRAAYRQWRFDQARHSRRLNSALAVPRTAAPAAPKRICTVLDFKGACARKARQAPMVETNTDVNMQDPRQRSSGTA